MFFFCFRNACLPLRTWQLRSQLQLHQNKWHVVSDLRMNTVYRSVTKILRVWSRTNPLYYMHYSIGRSGRHGLLTLHWLGHFTGPIAVFYWNSAQAGLFLCSLSHNHPSHIFTNTHPNQTHTFWNAILC